MAQRHDDERPRPTPSASTWRSAVRLVGRESELERLAAFAADAGVAGGALLLVGEAGVGKSALLDAVTATAAQARARVVRAAGVEFEAEVSFAGLHQILHPLLDRLPVLDRTSRTALEVGLGLGEGPTPDQLTMTNATLALLTAAAAGRPLLIAVDDLHWLDRASATLVGIVARRLESSGVAFVGAVHTGEGSLFESTGLPELDVAPLDTAASSELLNHRYPELPARTRHHVLIEAQGNPLALVELPAANHSAAGRPPGLAPAPVSRRLRAHYAKAVRGLPSSARHLLLKAALQGSGLDLSLPAGPDAVGLDPAEQAHLVRIDPLTRQVQFRHPLTRAAVVELSTDAQRRAAHQQIAAALAPDDERRAWHLAEAATGPTEEIALLLERAAERTQRRGDPVGAITLLLRAAELSPDPDDHHRRSMFAAYLGMDVTGDLADPRTLTAGPNPGHGQSVAAAIAAASYAINSGGDVDATHRLLVAAVQNARIPSEGWDQPLAEAVYVLNANCSFGSRADMVAEYRATLAGLATKPPEILELLGDTFLEPARCSPLALERLDQAIERIDERTNHVEAVRLGIAAMYVDRLPGCRAALWRVIEHGRAGGAVTAAIKAFAVLGFDGLQTGDWDGVLALAAEGLEITERHRYRLMGGFLHYDQAMVAAARGNHDVVRTLTDEMVRWAAPSRIGFVLQLAAHARALSALGAGDPEAAYRFAADVCSPITVPTHAPSALWVLYDLVDAAVRAGLTDHATRHATDIDNTGLVAISPRLALVTAGTTALVASADDYQSAYDSALALPEADRWPFLQARIRLAYGERLRRARKAAAARSQLDAALVSFTRLGARPWIDRTNHELRAIGQPSAVRGPTSVAGLTPQQREIAMLAASGLTNKQIGERLFLSPRTVATHLYQLFPKLGISSRAALRDALGPDPSDAPRQQQV